MIGKTISHYKILKKLVESGMGMVYKAQDSRLNRPVALKIFPNFSLSKSEEKKTLLNEARAASSLNHPNIVTIYDIGEDNGFSFIVMLMYNFRFYYNAFLLHLQLSFVEGLMHSQ